MQNQQSKGDELEERLIDFAVRIIKLSARLPKTPAGKHVAGQILRSGTSPAPNYGEARGAESRADFVHKLSAPVRKRATHGFGSKVFFNEKWQMENGKWKMVVNHD